MSSSAAPSIAADIDGLPMALPDLFPDDQNKNQQGCTEADHRPPSPFKNFHAPGSRSDKTPTATASSAS